MRRLLPVALLAVLSVIALAPAHAAERITVGTSTAVTDPRNDVNKNYAPYVRRRADLDIRKVTAAAKDDKVVLRIKVADLKKKHLKEEIKDGWHSIPSSISVFVYFGKNLRWVVIYESSGRPSVYATNLRTENDVPMPDCRDEDDMSRITQKAHYGKDFVAYTIPVDCLPADYAQARVNGGTSWDNEQGVAMWDDFYNNGYGKPDKRSRPFGFR